MLKIAICDDEKYMIDLLDENITMYLFGRKIDAEIFHFLSGEKLLKSDEKMDIIFLDIQMGKMDGLETAKELRRKRYKGFLIFVTIYRDYVFDSFEVQAFDYLLKPLQMEDFIRTMNRLFQAVQSSQEKQLLVQKGNTLDLISFEDVMYCESINRKIYLHLEDGRVLDYYDKIMNLEKKLDSRFYKCHRSYLVNLQYLKSYKDGLAYLEKGETIPVSRLRGNEFSNAVLQYIQDKRDGKLWR